MEGHTNSSLKKKQSGLHLRRMASNPDKLISAQSLNNEAKKAGYINKKRGSGFREKFDGTNWPLVYLVITDKMMYWYDRPTDSKCKGSVSLAGYNRVQRLDATDEKGRMVPPNAFAMIHAYAPDSMHKTYYFHTYDQKELKDWMSKIKTALFSATKTVMAEFQIRRPTDEDSFGEIEESLYEATDSIEKKLQEMSTNNNHENSFDDEVGYVHIDENASVMVASSPPNYPNNETATLSDYEKISDEELRDEGSTSSRGSDEVHTPSDARPALPPRRGRADSADSQLVRPPSKPKIALPPLPSAKAPLSMVNRRLPSPPITGNNSDQPVGKSAALKPPPGSGTFLNELKNRQSSSDTPSAAINGRHRSRRGSIPSNPPPDPNPSLDQDHRLKCFYYDGTTTAATLLHEAASFGMYIIRPSSKQTGYVLCVYSSHVHSIPIQVYQDETIGIKSEEKVLEHEKFPSVRALVTYYTDQDIVLNNGKHIRLTTSHPSCGYQNSQ